MFTKTIRKFFLSYLVLVLFQPLYAQQNPFVEVLIEDSIQLEPDKIIYVITAVRDYDNESTSTVWLDSLNGDSKPVNKKAKKQINNLSEIRAVVLQMKLDTLPQPVSVLINSKYYDEGKSLWIKLSSLDQLKTFTKKLSSIENITGGIVDMSSVKIQEYTQLLLQRLVRKGSTEAAILAQSAGKKLGPIQQIREVAETESIGWTSYPPLSRIPGWHAEISNPANEKIILRKRLAIQFTWQ